MDTYDTMFSAGHVLNERIARHVFDVLPERGLVVAILSRDGHCWPSDSDAFARLDLSETLLADLRAQVDDGGDPVSAEAGDISVMMAQLATDRTNCGYVLVARPAGQAVPLALDVDLAEAFFSQITLVARLIENSRRGAETDMTPYSGYISGKGCTN